MKLSSYIGKAEGIRSKEINAKANIERIESRLELLENKESSLDSQLSFLEAEYAAAQMDTDEEGYPNYSRMAMIAARIDAVRSQLEEVVGEIRIMRDDLEDSRRELREAEESRRSTLREIEEHARISSRNMSLAGGMVGAYASIGGKLQGTIQSGIAALAQAATILGGSVSVDEAGSSSSSGGSISSPSSIGGQKGLSRSLGALNAAVSGGGKNVSSRVNFVSSNRSHVSPGMVLGNTINSNSAMSSPLSGGAYKSSRTKSSAPSGTSNASDNISSVSSHLPRSFYESTAKPSGMQNRLSAENTGKIKRITLPPPCGFFYDDYISTIASVNKGIFNGTGTFYLGSRLYNTRIYTAEVNATDPDDNIRKHLKSTRRVIQLDDNSINLDLVIPAGTKYNGKSIKKDTTNRQLMAEGKAPFVMGKNGRLVKLELHVTIQ